jgi:signal transduction histidine kinase
MSVAAWFRPPRHLIALFVLLTLLPSALLLAFGWRLLQQEKALAGRQVEAEREEAADLAVSTLDRAVAGVEERLRQRQRAGEIAVTSDSVVVFFEDKQVTAAPHGRLLYYPVGTPGASARESVFQGGEELEYQRQDAAAAAAWFERQARSTRNSAFRAGALVRAARNFAKSGSHERALDTYGEAASIGDAAIGDVPVGLFARWARCRLLEILGRREQLRREALELQALLFEPRWTVERPVFQMHVQEVTRWSDRAESAAERLALSEVVDRVWQQHRGDDGVPARSTATAGGVEFTVLASGNQERSVALIAGPNYLQQELLSRSAAIEQRHGVRITLLRGVDRSLAPATSRRNPSDTGLPWTVVAHTLNDVSDAAGTRRVIWVAGLLLLASLALVGTWVIGRAVSRELAVARLQSDFVAAVSHEFRTPLTSLRQLSEMLVDRPGTAPEKRVEYYRALQRQTERLQGLVENLLDFGRMEAGTSPYRLQQLDAGGFVREVVDQFRAEVGARGSTIQLAQSAPVIVRGERDALANALWNLLDNAVKYSPSNGSIKVEVDRTAIEAAIRVRDEGFGIPQDEQREIFGKFVRGARARAERIRGTGIGLAIVRHVVSAHGGRIVVESAPGVGSTFSIVLPVADPQAGD